LKQKNTKFARFGALNKIEFSSKRRWINKKLRGQKALKQVEPLISSSNDLSVNYEQENYSQPVNPKSIHMKD
jgi:hypothetical protein